MIFLSSNSFSVDDQINDVVNWLSTHELTMYEQFVAEFPEYDSLEWSGSWVDWDSSGVDCDYMSWVADWIETNTPVVWEEGEPVIWQDFDNEELSVVIPKRGVEFTHHSSLAMVELPAWLTNRWDKVLCRDGHTRTMKFDPTYTDNSRSDMRLEFTDGTSEVYERAEMVIVNGP